MVTPIQLRIPTSVKMVHVFVVTATIGTFVSIMLANGRSWLISGETEKNISGWTVDTLKMHMDALRTADQRAVNTALVANEKRLDGLNELRQGVATKDAVDALEKVVDELKDRLNRIDGKSSGVNASWGFLIGAVGLTATIISVVLAFNN